MSTNDDAIMEEKIRCLYEDFGLSSYEIADALDTNTDEMERYINSAGLRLNRNVPEDALEKAKYLSKKKTNILMPASPRLSLIKTFIICPPPPLSIVLFPTNMLQQSCGIF